MVDALLEDGDKKGVLAVVNRLELEIKKLQHDLAALTAKRGRHSEGISSTQLALLLDELAEKQNAATDPEQTDAIQGGTDTKLGDIAELDKDLRKRANNPPKPPTRPSRRPLPDALPRRDNLLPVADASCPCCSQPTTKSLAPEIHEVLDYQPGQLFVRRDIREVRACTNPKCPEGGAVVRGPLGDKVIAGGAYGSALIAEIVVKKYRDGMSLHRIGQWLEREGFTMPSASMSDQVLWAADLLTPIWRALLDEVTRRSTLMQFDGTGMPVLRDDGGRTSSSRMGTLWGMVGDGQTVVYAYASSGHKTGQRDYDLGPEQILAMREKGYVVADADTKFDAAFRLYKLLIECGCSMHARRYFVRALDAGNKRAAIPLKAFKKLYLLERKFANDSLEGERLAEARQKRSQPVWEALHEWCQAVQAQGPPSSLLVVAARYVLRHYDALTRYLADGRIPIDNGLTERLFRRVAIMRRNALFVGSHDGGRRAAVLFSIFATCELLGINPAAYLADVLPRLARGITIATDLPDLMPAAWIERHPDARVKPLNVRRLTDIDDIDRS